MATCNGTTECLCDETDCPKSKETPPNGPAHCAHWYDNEGCCWCDDPPCEVGRRIAAEEASSTGGAT